MRGDTLLRGSGAGQALGRGFSGRSVPASLPSHTQTYRKFQKKRAPPVQSLSQDAAWPSSAHHSPTHSLAPATTSKATTPASFARSDLLTNILVAVIWPEGLLQAIKGRAQVTSLSCADVRPFRQRSLQLSYTDSWPVDFDYFLACQA